MKRIVLMLVVAISFAACKNKTDEGRFTINATVTNLPDQKVYLDLLHFSDKAPEVLDTAEVKAGKFSLSANAPEQGFYRIRFQNQEAGYVFINDQPEIKFVADAKDTTLQGPSFNTPANATLKNFLIRMDVKRNEYVAERKRIDAGLLTNASDSAKDAGARSLAALDQGFKNMVVSTMDTVSNPVVAEFLLGYTQGMDTSVVKKSIVSLQKRFPDHKALAGLITIYEKSITAPPAENPVTAGTQKNGMAPDFTMKDVQGKPFTLSSLRGKYVLVDFWASWCAPCRGENPNVVKAYNQFKNKNFTIVGVSLDEDKAAWQAAIMKDNLTWKHVSDLKGWENATVSLYGYQGIPYNVLIDPSGKIIATELRGPALQAKLAEVLK